jgi:DNA-binding transcriptional LysR family regulator
MEMNQIEAFARIVSEGSLTRAAQVIGVTQPAVSARLQALEATLGGKLFVRRGRILELTPLGENFLPYAQRMLAIAEEARQSAHNLQQGSAGQIRIAAPTPFLMSFLLPVILRFRRQHPHTDIVIRERNKTTIFDMLADHVVTLGLVNAPVFDPNATMLARFRDAIVPVVATAHWLAKTDKKLLLDDLLDVPIFRVSLFPRMTVFMDELVQRARHATGASMLAVPMVMAYELALQGQGVTFLPQNFVQSALQAGQLTQLTLHDMPTLYSEPILIKPTQRDLDTIHQTFVDMFTQPWHHHLIH